MIPLAVWAPAAARVEVVAGGGRQAMTRDDRGWWRSALDAPGDYAFSVDGGPPRPDPRSPWQPHGVHGPSRTVDHGAFRWTDAGWSAPKIGDGVIYEVHIGTFSPEGTFDGAIARLDALADLGVTHVEVMPVADFPGARGWGYDGVALFAPKHSYGGPDGLKRLVDACHARGLAAILDVVYNHLGPAGNYLGEFAPYFSDRYGTPWGRAVNLDAPGADEVRRFLCDNALSWLRDYRFDGLRLDAVNALFDQSAIHFLEQLGEEVRALSAESDRTLEVIAESDLNDPRVVRPVREGGYALDAQWSDDYHHALHAAVTGERNGYYEGFGPLALVARALADGFVFTGQYSPWRGRRHGRPLGDVSGNRLVGYVQNHDQVGNRAKGERWSHLVPGPAVFAAAALTLAAPFVPMLFQGEEWASSTPFPFFTDHEPDLGRLVTEGRRKEFAAFGWDPASIADPQAAETFESARLLWDERGRDPHRALLDWHRRLVRLRRATPALRDGDRGRVRTAFDEAGRWLRLDRAPFAVACNFGTSSARVPLAGTREVVLASCRHRIDGATLEMEPGAVVLSAGG